MTEKLSERICAITVEYPGVLQWLTHGHEEGLWNLVVLKGDVQVPRAEVYLLGAWHDAYVDLVPKLRAEAPDAKIIVAWSSSPFEMDTAPQEILALWGLVQPGVVDGFACLHPGLVPHLPNAFHLPGPIHLPETVSEGPKSGIAFYAPATLKKNVLSQLLAVKAFQDAKPNDPARVLHTNLKQHVPQMDLFGLKYELDGWLTRDALLKRLAESKVAMCASIGESFCYGAVDAMGQGTPVIGSRTIPWLQPHWLVDDPNDPRSVLSTLERVWGGSSSESGTVRRIIGGVASRQNHRTLDAILRLLGDKGFTPKAP